MKKKNIVCFCFLLCLMFFAFGCTNQVYDVTVLNDGRVEFSETIAIDMDILAKLNEKDIKFGEIYKQNKNSTDDIEKLHPLFQETAWQFSNKDFTIEPIEDSVQVGFKANKEYPNIDAFNKDLHSLYESGLSKLRVQINHQKNILKEIYTVSGDFEFFKDPEFKANEEEIDSLRAIINNPTISAKLNVKTPGKLRETNGEIANGKATFTANYDSKTPTKIKLVSGEESEKAKTLAIAGVIFAVILIIFLIFKNYRKIKFIIFRK